MGLGSFRWTKNIGGGFSANEFTPETKLLHFRQYKFLISLMSLQFTQWP